jgi:hypothetical protein
MKRGQSQNYSVPLSQDPVEVLRSFQTVSLVMEVEQRYVGKVFAEEAMKGAEIVDRRNKH